MTVEGVKGRKNVSGEVTITTNSERTFEMIKSRISGGDKFDSGKVTEKTSINESEDVFSLTWSGSLDGLDGTELRITENQGSVTYVIPEISSESEPVGEEERNMDEVSWFEGYSYNFTINLPGRIEKAWWLNALEEKISEVEPTHIQGKRLSIQAPMDKVLCPVKGNRWANREGLMIQTSE